MVIILINIVQKAYFLNINFSIPAPIKLAKIIPVSAKVPRTIAEKFESTGLWFSCRSISKSKINKEEPNIIFTFLTVIFNCLILLEIVFIIKSVLYL